MMMKNFRYYFLIPLFFASSFSHAQDMDEYFYDFHLLNELRGINGEECIRAQSKIPGEPKIVRLYPIYSSEVQVDILDDSQTRNVVSAIDAALEQSGFMPIEERIYGLQGSPLCFLKLYWSESSTTLRVIFVPYFMCSSDWENRVITQMYFPSEFESILDEELSMRGLDESAQASLGFTLIGSYFRRFFPDKPDPCSSDVDSAQ